MNNMANCPICRKYFNDKKSVLNHMDAKHYEQIPDTMSTGKYYYALNHDGETTGKCKICSNPTAFDEATGRVKILCENPKCKTAFSEMIQQRSINKLGVAFVLQKHDQVHQMEMLANRKISGKYMWSDGKTEIPYVGSYERRFLEFLDVFLDFDPSVIYAPCPIVINYEYNGETLQHSPDFYIDILNLIIEIKHGGSNPNKHPKIQAVDVAKDKAKEAAIKNTTEYNYIKIVDNDFKPFLLLMAQLSDQRVGITSNKRIVMINEAATEIAIQEPDGKALQFVIYGDKDGFEVNVCVLLSPDILIEYDVNEKQFKYVNDHNILFNNETVVFYSYIGDMAEIYSNIRKLLEYIGEDLQVEELSTFNAFANVFSRIFDKADNYNITDYILNTNIRKGKSIMSDGIYKRDSLIAAFAGEIARIQREADKWYYLHNNISMSSFMLNKVDPLKELAGRLGITNEVYAAAYNLYDFRNSGKDGYKPNLDELKLEWVDSPISKKVQVLKLTDADIKNSIYEN